MSVLNTGSEKNSDNSLNFKNSSNGAGNQLKRKKIVIAGNSLLNDINENGLSKIYNVKVNNKPGGKSDAILYELGEFLKNIRDSLIVHVGTSNIQRKKIYR